MLDSIQRGFTFIELDLLVTADNIIIGAHDWIHFKNLIGFFEKSDSPLTYSEVKDQKINGKYTVISSKEICSLMEQYPDFYLVTDKIRDYTVLLEQIPFPDRLVVEVFSFDDYYRALTAGIKYPALCIAPPNELLFKKVLKYKIPMITTGGDWIYNKPGFLENLKKLHEEEVAIFLFYIYFEREVLKPSFLKEYMGKVFSKFYINMDYKESIRINMQ